MPKLRIIILKDRCHGWQCTCTNCALSSTLISWLGIMSGRPSSYSFLEPQLSNQWRPAHSSSMWITADWVMILSILFSPRSTTGILFILYLDSSRSMVKKEFDFCSARNGAHRNDPEMSRTYLVKVMHVKNQENLPIKLKFCSRRTKNKEKRMWPWCFYRNQRKSEFRSSFHKLQWEIQGANFCISEKTFRLLLQLQLDRRNHLLSILHPYLQMLPTFQPAWRRDNHNVIIFLSKGLLLVKTNNF